MNLNMSWLNQNALYERNIMELFFDQKTSLFKHLLSF